MAASKHQSTPKYSASDDEALRREETIMDIGFLIDGAERGAAGGATYDRNDPFTGKLATRAAAASGLTRRYFHMLRAKKK